MNDIDILSVDAQIQQFFESEYKKLDQYNDRLKELEETLNGVINHRTRIELEKNINSLKEKIRETESKERLNFYLFETIQILDSYRKLLKVPIKIQFCGKKRDVNESEKHKHELISNYIQIASKYYQINIKQTEKKFNIRCESCSNTTNFSIEENMYICMECGVQQEIIQHTASYKDTDRVNITSKYTYDPKVHFRDSINQYQGKQNCTVEPEVYVKLEDILDRHHLLVGDKNTKKRIRFSKITKEHILMFLKELEFTKHYENVTLIHYNMTGKKPDDISYLEDKLLADFDLLGETYERLFKNSTDKVKSTHYILYQLLQRHKHPCKREDFAILKTIERKTFYDNICKQLFDTLGWNFTPLY
jgi:hypothetical protein